MSVAASNSQQVWVIALLAIALVGLVIGFFVMTRRRSAEIRKLTEKLSSEIEKSHEAKKENRPSVVATERLTQSEEIPRGTGEHVLIVDDEPKLAKGVQRLLEHAGYRVTIC